MPPWYGVFCYDKRLCKDPHRDGLLCPVRAALLIRGVEDGSLVTLDADGTAQVVISLLVGANRTRVLTPYAPEGLYEETLAFVSRSIRSRAEAPTDWGNAPVK